MRTLSIQVSSRPLHRIFKEMCSSKGITSETCYKNNMVFKKYIQQYMGDKPLASITPHDCAAWLMKVRTDNPHLKNSTVHWITRTFKSVFNYAVNMDYIIKSPARNLRVPLQQVSKEMVRDYVFHPDELSAFMKAASQHFMYPFFLTTLRTGMRVGEVIELRWSDVYLTNVNSPYICVRRTAGRDHTKTYVERNIPIMADLADMLSLRWQTSKASKDDLVFERRNPLKHRIEAFNKANISAFMNRFLKAAGIERRITFHAFRHTFCSALVAKGQDISTIQYLMGHSTMGTTMGYIHIWGDKSHLVNAITELGNIGAITSDPAV